MLIIAPRVTYDYQVTEEGCQFFLGIKPSQDFRKWLTDRDYQVSDVLFTLDGIKNEVWISTTPELGMLIKLTLNSNEEKGE